eukprot:4775219-Alexandrium_andersonii.AAC.1
MSASLVGSEMCIRDRLFAPIPNLTTKVAVLEVPRGFRGEAPWEFGGKPVSYTHLTLPTICSV